MLDMKKHEKKIRKIQELENGKRQFCAIPRPLTAYVFVNNISAAVAVGR